MSFRIIDSSSLIPLEDYDNSFFDKNGKLIKTNHQGHIYQIVREEKQALGRWALLIRKICYQVLMLLSSGYLDRYTPIRNLQKTEHSIYSLMALDAEKEKLVKDYTPQMINALGGLNSFIKKIPVLPNKWESAIESNLTCGIMRGSYQTSTMASPLPCLIFRYIKVADPDTKNPYEKPYYDIITKSTDGKKWIHRESNFNLIFISEFEIESRTESYFLDRIHRFRFCKALGCVSYCSSPDDSPADAYLETEQVKPFIITNSINVIAKDSKNFRYLYEKKPEEKTTALLPFPSDWRTICKKHFPNQKIPLEKPKRNLDDLGDGDILKVDDE